MPDPTTPAAPPTPKTGIPPAPTKTPFSAGAAPTVKVTLPGAPPKPVVDEPVQAAETPIVTDQTLAEQKAGRVSVNIFSDKLSAEQAAGQKAVERATQIEERRAARMAQLAAEQEAQGIPPSPQRMSNQLYQNVGKG